MNRKVACTAVIIVCLLFSGCLANSPNQKPHPAGQVEKKSFPQKPGGLNNSSALEYAVGYEGVYLNNKIVQEYNESSIAAINPCEYPAEDPQDGGFDHWVEKKWNGQFYIALFCPVEIDQEGAEQSGSGSVGEWTMYAVTAESTRRVELGNNIVEVQNRLVNFDNESRTVTITVSNNAQSEAVVEKTYEVGGTSYSTIQANASRNTTYEVDVLIDGGEAKSYTVSVSKGQNIFNQTGIYISPTGILVIDRQTETYRASSG